MIELRLTHPAIDFWVDVRLRPFGDAWLAVADLASTPEIAVASRPDLAVLLAPATRPRPGDEPCGTSDASDLMADETRKKFLITRQAHRAHSR